MNVPMWMPLPASLAVQSGLLVAWYVVALWLVLGLPARDDSGQTAALPALAWWRTPFHAILVFVGVTAVAIPLWDGDALRAYGTALVAAAVWLVLIRDRDGGSSAIGSDRRWIWLLALGALWLRLAGADTDPPGLSEDEAKKAFDCVKILQGNATAFSVGSLAHPNFQCLYIGPLLAAFGPSVQVAHGYVAFLGALSVVAFHALASMMLLPAPSLAATVLFAASPFHVLYSHVMWGAEITLPQILLLAFALDAARRLSWRSALMAGSALGISLLNYQVAKALPAMVAVIFALAQIEDWRRWRARFAAGSVLVLAAAAVLLPLLQDPDGRSFLFTQPTGLLAIDSHSGASAVMGYLVKAVRVHLRLFHISEFGGHTGVMAHSRIAMLPLSLELLLAVGFADAAVRLTKVPRLVAAATFVLGLLPSILSGEANTHRAMLALPAVYLLIGVGLERMVQTLGGRLWRAAALGLLLLVTIASYQSIRFYFGPAWADINDLGNFGSGTVQQANAVRDLGKEGKTFSTSVPPWIEFLNYDQIHANQLLRFNYTDWLAENWSPESRGMFFDVYWTPMSRALREMLPAGGFRELLDARGWPAGDILQITAGHQEQLKALTPTSPGCGSLMLRTPRRVVVLSGELEIDGARMTAVEPHPPWFGAGLHRACIPEPASVRLTAPSGEVDVVSLSAASLYQLPVHGWAHRVRCRTTDKLDYLAIEPFLFHVGMGRAMSVPCTDQVEHTWSAVIEPRTEPLSMMLWFASNPVEVLIDGAPVALEPSFGEYQPLRLPPHSRPRRIDIRLPTWGYSALNIALYAVPTMTQQIPRYDTFSPSPGEAVAAASDVAWPDPESPAAPPGAGIEEAADDHG